MSKPLAIGESETSWDDDDGNSYERRTKRTDDNECPHCGHAVEMFAHTEEWVKSKETQGRMLHKDYGLSTGVCEDREILIAETFEGIEFYRIPRKP